MIKKIMIITLFIIMIFSATKIKAQEVLMNSAETINPGNFKLAIFPTALLGNNGWDTVWGVAGRAGLGLTNRVDIEAKGAIFKNLTYFGVDIEYWFHHGKSINASALAGFHVTEWKSGLKSSGIDVAVLLSTRPAKRLEIYCGLKLAFDSFNRFNQNFTLAHIVPGFEYRITSEIDFLAEYGISLNNRSKNYFSIGFAYYFLK